MSHLNDIDIAKTADKKPINEIAENLGISKEEFIPYGHYKAKIDVNMNKEEFEKNKGKLVLVTAISPTPAGEGKTTMSVGLADGLAQIGKKSVLALREPSLGPVFGMKGGAAGGGYAQVVPMEDINLHFTGDFHAISSAHNLISALLDNHIHHGNSLNIDTRKIHWKRVVDMNDRQLRHIVNGLNGSTNGVPREDGYDITVASEIMAIFCLSEDLIDLKERISRIIVAYTHDNQPVTVDDLKGSGAVTALLVDAFKPNLVQTLENTPAFIHGGPFANIAHGCNSILATKHALLYGDYAVTEAGFGADLGGEKFIDIKCRTAELAPDAVVVVATVKALKMHGGVSKQHLNEENVIAVKKGLVNLKHHIQTMKDVFNLNTVVGINHFFTDTDAEVQVILDACQEWGIKASVAKVWEQGGKGATELAQLVVEACENKTNMTFAYDLDTTLMDKITHVVQKVYGGKGATYTNKAMKQLKEIEQVGFGQLPVCMAKTQYSLSDTASLIGAPTDFDIKIKELRLSAGAGFIVAITGTIMTMPGLPKKPSAESIDVDKEGNITGLF
ncbi:formate--tetrahydrofolate ligase [Aerococcaceae bacterium INB8]|uniref:Formate--tetrahydrofolate ligase n=1 Tax=Ruoffia halotolerans TaxID=2748684 RepID=A0A839A4K2_9LACT|nr:formate--tetrahydrofolate ligase [Ruoffia halotolerans]MBA5728764.1 formate--tetrahydrofolate ligase [Ruoffia halotolerans]